MGKDVLPVGFHFGVRFLGMNQQVDQEFQQVTGLSVEVELEEIAEGGENRFKHKLPKGSKYGDLTLKRGLSPHSQVLEWCRKAVEELDIVPYDLQISLLDAQHMPLATWTVVNAYPIQWSVADFHAEESKVVIESLKLGFDYFTLKT